MKYRIGSMVIVEQNGKEHLVLVSSKGRGGFAGIVPVTNKRLSGYEYQVKTVVRY